MSIRSHRKTSRSSAISFRWQRFACALFVLALFVAAHTASAQSHKGINVQAFIKKPNGEPLTAPGSTITLQVLSPNNCVLLEEEHTSVGISDGFLNLVLGTGTRVGSDKGDPLATVLNNKATRTGLDLSGAAVGSGGCTFTPNVSGQDPRKLRMVLNGGGDVIQADFNIRASAYAIESEKLEGKGASDFVQVNAGKNVTQAKVEDFFDALTNGSSQGGVKWNGSAFVSYDPASGAGFANDSIPATAVAGLPWSKLTSVPAGLTEIGGLTCADGKILKRASGAWTCADDATGGGGGSGTVTSVDLTVPSILSVTGGPVTTSGTLAVSLANQAANKVFAGPTSGGNAAPTFRSLNITDIRSSNGGGAFLNAGGSCGVGEALTYLAPSDTIECAAVGVTSSQVTTALGYTPVNKAGDTMTGALALASNGLTVGTSQLAVSSGNVGVGTASPTATLHIKNAGGGPSLTVWDRAGSGVAWMGEWGDFHGGSLQAGSGSELGRLTIRDDGTSRNSVAFFGQDDANVKGLTILNQSYSLTDTNGLSLWQTNAGVARIGNAGAANPAGISIGTTGNVGIATTSPGYNLDVAGDMNFSGVLRTQGAYMAGSGPAELWFGDALGQGNGVALWTHGGRRVTIDTTGNVGINTASPTGGRLDINGGTQTTSLPIHNGVQTWNAAGVAFTAAKLNVTNTASAASSLLLDLQVGGVSQFRVDKAGKVYGDGSGLTGIAATSASGSGGDVQINNGSNAFTATGNLNYNTTSHQLTLNTSNAPTGNALVIARNPTASDTKSLIRLGTADLAAASGNGTYIGVNQPTGTADFINYQIAGGSRFIVDEWGLVYSGGIYVAGENGGFGQRFSVSDQGMSNTDVVGIDQDDENTRALAIVNKTYYSTNGTKALKLWQTNAGVARISNAAAADPAGISIGTTGNVGIETAAPGEKLEVNGNVKATSFISTSDRRLKDNITPIEGLATIRRLNGVSWRWKESRQTDAGVIAQELEEVIPFAVVTDPRTGLKSVKYSALIAPLIESTKDLYGRCEAQSVELARQSRGIASLHESVNGLAAENASLKQEMHELKTENAALKSRLEAIEKHLGLGR